MDVQESTEKVTESNEQKSSEEAAKTACDGDQQKVKAKTISIDLPVEQHVPYLQNLETLLQFEVLRLIFLLLFFQIFPIRYFIFSSEESN